MTRTHRLDRCVVTIDAEACRVVTRWDDGVELVAEPQWESEEQRRTARELGYGEGDAGRK